MNQHYLIDGTNVCQWRGSKTFSLSTLFCLLDKLLEQEDTFTCIFDANTRYTIEASDKDHPLAQQIYLQFLENFSEFFVEVTGGTRADDPILFKANISDLSVISNDRYRDYIDSYSWLKDPAPRLIKGNIIGSDLILHSIDLAVNLQGELSVITDKVVIALTKISRRNENGDPIFQLDGEYVVPITQPAEEKFSNPYAYSNEYELPRMSSRIEIEIPDSDIRNTKQNVNYDSDLAEWERDLSLMLQSYLIRYGVLDEICAEAGFGNHAVGSREGDLSSIRKMKHAISVLRLRGYSKADVHAMGAEWDKFIDRYENAVKKYVETGIAYVPLSASPEVFSLVKRKSLRLMRMLKWGLTTAEFDLLHREMRAIVPRWTAEKRPETYTRTLTYLIDAGFEARKLSPTNFIASIPFRFFRKLVK